MFFKSRLIVITLLSAVFTHAFAAEGTDVKADDEISSSVLQAQVLLDRAMVSPGAIDGRTGTNSEHALRAFQKSHGLKVTGKLDEATSDALTADAAVEDFVKEYRVGEDDWAHPFIESLPDDMQKQAELDALSYTTITELLAERFHCTPELLVHLNPESDWSTGSEVLVPNVTPTWVRVKEEQLSQWVEKQYGDDEQSKADNGGADGDEADYDRKDDDDKDRKEESAADDESKSADKPDDQETRKDDKDDLAGQKTDDGRITSSGLQMKPSGNLTVVVTKEDTSLNVVDERGRVVFHAPITAGSEHDPLPLGEWKINGTERFPKFNYNPELFWDADDDDKKAKIPAGPNNPVGVAWIDISKPHYGLHGTPDAETIGYSESHGCVRLTNWDVLRLADMVKPETQVLFLEKAEELDAVIKDRAASNDERDETGDGKEKKEK